MAKDTQIYGSVELRDESKTSEYGTFTRSERKTNHGRNSTVGLKIPQTPAARPARKGTWFLIVIVDVSTFKHLIGRCASAAEQRHVGYG